MRREETTIANANQDDLVQWAFRVGNELHDCNTIAILVPRSNQLAIWTIAELLAICEQALTINCDKFTVATDAFAEHSYAIFRDLLRVELFIV